MSPEKFTPPEARAEGFEATPKAAEHMAHEAKETEERTPEQKIIIEAFENVVDEVLKQRPELEDLINEIKEEAFSGRGDVYEEMARALEGKKELGMTDEQIRKFAENIVRKRLLRMTPPKMPRRAA